MEFKVGDIVNVRGTVGQVWAGGNMADVKFNPDQNAASIPTKLLTLVKRPPLFKVGSKYRFPNEIRQYMYLGDGKWYSYASEEVIESSELDTPSLKLIED